MLLGLLIYLLRTGYLLRILGRIKRLLWMIARRIKHLLSILSGISLLLRRWRRSRDSDRLRRRSRNSDRLRGISRATSLLLVVV
jgi:hypothetical protein